MCDLDIMEKNQRLGSQMLARIIANPDTCGHACLVVQSCPPVSFSSSVLLLEGRGDKLVVNLLF